MKGFRLTQLTYGICDNFNLLDVFQLSLTLNSTLCIERSTDWHMDIVYSLMCSLFFFQKCITYIQIEAAKGFLSVLRSYLDSLCSNLRSHTITNVQSNNDKVSTFLQITMFSAKNFLYSFNVSLLKMLESFLFQVSLLLKESFIDSFPSRHRPFMRVCYFEHLSYTSH